jgi:hypothetical protein
MGPHHAALELRLVQAEVRLDRRPPIQPGRRAAGMSTKRPAAYTFTAGKIGIIRCGRNRPNNVVPSC